MTDKIRGITIEIGGDTSGLSKALKGVNSEISNTQKQLKDVERLLKLDPSNTELLNQKQRLLNQSVEEYEDKLRTLTQQQERFKEAAESGDQKAIESYEALNREIISTQEYLKKAKSEAEGFNVTLEKAKVAADKVAKGAESISQKTRGLSAAAAGVVTGLAGAAYNAVKASDDMNTLAKQSGLTTEELQKFDYAADVVDVSTDTIVSSVRRMRRNMDSNSKEVQESWARIGVSVRDADGNFRNSIDVFYDALDGLSQIENETERDIVAMQLFGKSADELAGIIDDGGAALKELGNQAEELGLIMDQDTLDSLNAVNDEIDILKANMRGTIAKSGAKALEAFEPVLEKIIQRIDSLLERIGSMDADQMELILKIATIIALISPVAGIIGKISGAVGGLLNILPKISAGFDKVLAFVMANPWVLIAAAIVAAVALIIKNWDKIKEAATAVKDWVVEKFTALRDGIVNLVENAKQWGRDLIDNFLGGLKEKAQALTDGVKGIAQKVKDFIGFSEPKDGPLRDFHTYAPDMIDLFVQGIESNSARIGSAFNGALGMNPNMSVSDSKQTVTHSGTIHVEGVNNQKEFVAAADYAIEDVLVGILRKQARTV